MPHPQVYSFESTIIGTQRGDIIIANAVNNARIFGLGGNDIIECGIGNCNVFTGFGHCIFRTLTTPSQHPLDETKMGRPKVHLILDVEHELVGKYFLSVVHILHISYVPRLWNHTFYVSFKCKK
jgi:hypothetical protein